VSSKPVIGKHVNFAKPIRSKDLAPVPLDLQLKLIALVRSLPSRKQP
jgi:hypothetical protein